MRDAGEHDRRWLLSLAAPGVRAGDWHLEDEFGRRAFDRATGAKVQGEVLLWQRRAQLGGERDHVAGMEVDLRLDELSAEADAYRRGVCTEQRQRLQRSARRGADRL